MKLIDVCELIVDCPHTTAKDEGEGFPLIRTPNVGKGYLILDGVHRVSQEVYDARNARAIPQADDIILAREAPAGNVALIKEEQNVCLGQRTVLIRPDKKKVNPTFLTYYLLSPAKQHDFKSAANGATVEHINMPKIRGLEIALPPRSVQDSIATTLSRYDALIANYQRQIKLLEEAAQRLYKEWFVDLRFPGHENVKVMDGVPEGWGKKSITDLLEIKYGKDYKALKEGKYPVYGTGGVMRYVDNRLYCGESVLIPRKGSLNNIMLVEDSFWSIDTMFYSIPKMKDVAKIAYFYLNGLDMYNLNNGAAVPSMTVQILSTLKLLLPNAETRSMFEAKVSRMYAHIRNLQRSITLLTESRDRLLPKLMSGEIER